MEVSFRRRRWLTRMSDELGDEYELQGALMVKFPKTKSWRRRYFALHTEALWFGRDASRLDQCLRLNSFQFRRSYQATLEVLLAADSTTTASPHHRLMLRMESILARNRWHEAIQTRQETILANQELARLQKRQMALAAGKVTFPTLLTPLTAASPSSWFKEETASQDTSTTATDGASATSWSSVRPSHYWGQWRGTVGRGLEEDTVVSVLSDDNDHEHVFGIATTTVEDRNAQQVQKVWRGFRTRRTYAPVLQSRTLQRTLQVSQTARLRGIIEVQAAVCLQQWWRRIQEQQWDQSAEQIKGSFWDIEGPSFWTDVGRLLVGQHPREGVISSTVSTSGSSSIAASCDCAASCSSSWAAGRRWKASIRGTVHHQELARRRRRRFKIAGLLVAGGLCGTAAAVSLACPPLTEWAADVLPESQQRACRAVVAMNAGILEHGVPIASRGSFLLEWILPDPTMKTQNNLVARGHDLAHEVWSRMMSHPELARIHQTLVRMYGSQYQHMVQLQEQALVMTRPWIQQQEQAWRVIRARQGQRLTEIAAWASEYHRRLVKIYQYALEQLWEEVVPNDDHRKAARTTKKKARRRRQARNYDTALDVDQQHEKIARLRKDSTGQPSNAPSYAFHRAFVPYEGFSLVRVTHDEDAS